MRPLLLMISLLYRPPSQVFPTFDRLAGSIPLLGLTLSLPKSIALLPDLTSDLTNLCASRGIPYSDVSIPSLGTIISRYPDIISKWLVTQVSTLQAILDLVYLLSMPFSYFVLV